MSYIARSSRSERPIENYTEWETIGRGGFGDVFKAKNKLGEVVAIKKIPRKGRYPRVEDEVRVIQKLSESGNRNNRIVKFIDSFVDEKYTYIVMEYCERGTLRQYIQQFGPLEPAIAADVLSQLIEGLSFIHDNGIMHRDITASNVLISRIKEGRLYVKISDFGLTKEAPREAVRGTCLGTPGYMAPQVLNKQQYGKQADIYSLGAILFVMLNKEEPQNCSWDSTGCPKFSNCKDLDEMALDAINKMMWKQEDKRITLAELEHHPFIMLAYQQRLHEMKLNPPIAHGQLSDSGKGSSGLPSNYRARSVSRCRHTSRGSNYCYECKLLLPDNATTNTLRPVTNVSLPRRNTRRTGSVDFSTQASQKPTNFTNTSPVKRKISPLYDWPIPDVRHLESLHTNSFGRCAIRSPVNKNEPFMVFEMPDETNKAKLIFEVYNISPNPQRLLVFEPKEAREIPRGREAFLEKNFKSEKRFRSQEEILNASEDIKTGYKRLHQFIKLFESRVNHCYIKHAFGHTNHNLFLKYNNTIELNFGDKSAKQLPTGEFTEGFNQFTPEQQIIAKCGCLKLRQMADNSMLQQLSEKERKAAENYVRKPFAVLWTKNTPR